MKAEPLKDKIATRYSRGFDGSEREFEFLEVEDVKSAVEWLKEKFKNIQKRQIEIGLTGDEGVHVEVIIRKINEAFEDVTKT